MRQQELHDDEEREHRRDDDLRDTCAPPHHPIPSLADSIAHDSEQDNWRAVWETISHPSQVSSLSEYTELDTFVSRLWPRKPKASKAKAGWQPNLDPAYYHPCPMENLKHQGYDYSKALASVTYGSLEKAHSWMWRQQWALENLSPPLFSQSYPPPSRMPDYCCREVIVMEPNVLSRHPLSKTAWGFAENTPNMLSCHPLLKVASGADRSSCVVEVKPDEIQKAMVRNQKISLLQNEHIQRQIQLLNNNSRILLNGCKKKDDSETLQ
jgi:hypothetical protein